MYRNFYLEKRADFETKVRIPTLNNKQVNTLAIRYKKMDTGAFSLRLETVTTFSFTSASGTNFAGGGAPEIVGLSQLSHILIFLLRRLLYKYNQTTGGTLLCILRTPYSKDPQKPISERKKRLSH